MKTAVPSAPLLFGNGDEKGRFTGNTLLSGGKDDARAIYTE
jgi:hypothetical protein